MAKTTAIFIKIDGIEGESEYKEHEKEIDVESISWGMSQPSTMALGGGGGAGKATVRDLSFNHFVDKASPNLMLYCLQGKHVAKATVSVRKAGGEKPLKYLKIEMEDIIVSNVSVSCSEADERPIESVSLSFAKVKFEYQAQDKTGKAAGGVVQAGWDIKKNVKV